MEEPYKDSSDGNAHRQRGRRGRWETQPSAQVTSATVASVVGYSLPEQAEHDEVAVLLVDAGPAEFNQLCANRLEGVEIKLLFAVVAKILRCGQASLQAICADNFTSWHMLHEQMVAHIIERVGIQAGCERFGQPLVQFEIEDGEAQRLRRADLGRFQRGRKPADIA